ncbi:carboxypeptidase regulatory-like domain-containing protein [bacterium]|uniref:SD-repeat containing protein B domain-containing protein n=2 Tax=Katanobacteria TaxID=422282 RepID=A0A2M7X2T4_UNCKA|nr:carboxypeptidase regulatory-like domain-containing protein [bacterium]PIP56451.1 MAG: hypothetical protein COX05_03005 [candidate division WWE3 bacterium CG22_combo_CG10-13_8_21_14_all_39_12]PJA40470.1 MAG: hypothetical protein CO179_02215 [candidate division WWE3 bacterium CG_4_9_14_3_um_filter_39_7]
MQDQVLRSKSLVVRVVLTLIALFVVLWAGVKFAEAAAEPVDQSAVSSVSGRVFMLENGKEVGIVGMNLTLTSEVNGTVTVYTDLEGYYVFNTDGFAVGTYTLTVERWEGFICDTPCSVEVNLGGEVSPGLVVDFKLIFLKKRVWMPAMFR